MPDSSSPKEGGDPYNKMSYIKFVLFGSNLAQFKAKLFQEATFFIIIFTYLRQIYRSQMAKEYSAD